MADGEGVVDGIVDITAAGVDRVADLAGDATVQAFGIAGDVGKQLARLPAKVVTHKLTRTVALGGAGVAAGVAVTKGVASSASVMVAPKALVAGAGLVGLGVVAKKYMNHRADLAKISADPDLSTLRSERRSARPYERQAQSAENQAARAESRRARAERRFVRRAQRIHPTAESYDTTPSDVRIALKLKDRRAKKAFRRMGQQAALAGSREVRARQARDAATPHQVRAAAAREQALAKPPETMPRGRLALRSLGLSKGLLKGPT
ncbi:hypothetical protein LO772_18820 [Yinghuangia sp. ASG 101]|uniref:hypothetical protein n=1 Tax=Yinghuangia sp. ASG 101 TaxID=2896848 RepID=UPI001E57796B|nr:hypothetical protein [Yinghuangia sp. ASG 101]UGQ09024.1 hypothetical protein LO772_18820 [Yinghuangia sp. ASG 101]